MSPRKKQVTYSRRPNHAARSAHARGERQFRTYDTSYIRPKRKSVAPIIFAIVLALAVLGGLAWGSLTLLNSCSSSAVELLPEGEKVTVVIEDGAGARAIGQELQEARLIASSSDFTKRVNELGVDGELKPGTYTFTGGTSLDDIIHTLQAGPQVEGVTIPEGYTIKQIADAVAQATENRITAENFVAAASDASVYAADYAFLAEVGTNSLEGFLVPKTYAIDDTTTADSLVRAMLTQFQTEIASLDWSYPESQGLSLYQAVNLASIVEKESSGEEAVRAKVAAVFYNRLSTTGETVGFLQSDATTVYENGGQDPTPEQVHADTPYSTYSNPGLPPTPICSPGLDCLMAVCAPDQEALGKYFYFYFDEEQNYFFSETYEEHQQTFS